MTETKPDAFKAVLEAAKSEGRQDLAHQSLGRPLSDAEAELAAALMEIYGSGTTGPEAVAAALNEKGVAAPSTGKTTWSAENLASELARLNKDLDGAYQDNGFGA